MRPNAEVDETRAIMLMASTLISAKIDVPELNDRQLCVRISE